MAMHSGQDLSNFSLFCPLLDPKRGQLLYLKHSESPSPKRLQIAKWFLRISRLKEKLTDDNDDDNTTNDGRIEMAIFLG